jgi:hypothetical protein
VGDTNAKSVTLTYGELWGVIVLSAIASAGVAITLIASAASNWHFVALAISLSSAGCIGQIVKQARRRGSPVPAEDPLRRE